MQNIKTVQHMILADLCEAERQARNLRAAGHLGVRVVSVSLGYSVRSQGVMS